MSLDFKSLLKFHRLRNGYGLRQFARLIEEAPSNYANVEAGRRKPWRNKDKLRAIAKALALREGSQEWDRFFIAATVIPPGIDRLLGRPMILALLRAIDELKPSENDLRRLIETLHKGVTMNESIKVVNDTTISTPFLDASMHSNGLTLTQGHEHVHIPLDGLPCIRDALTCLIETGSFAALADTSAVLFTGKRVRIKGHKEEEFVCRRVECKATHLLQSTTNPTTIRIPTDDNVLPIAEPEPAKKYRPYTPAEATCLLGKTIVYAGGCWEVVAVRKTEIEIRKYHDATRSWIAYRNLLNATCDGRQCGVLESE